MLKQDVVKSDCSGSRPTLSKREFEQVRSLLDQMLDLALFMQEKLIRSNYESLDQVNEDLASTLLFDDYFNDDFCHDLYAKVTFLDKYVFCKLVEMKTEIVDGLTAQFGPQAYDKVNSVFDSCLEQVSGDTPKMTDELLL